MAATFNPQAAADQTRNAYRSITAQLGLLALDTAIPEALGALAEKAVGQTRNAYRLVTILILIFAVGFMASAFAGATAPKTQAACEKAGMDWDATASAPTVKCHFRFA